MPLIPRLLIKIKRTFLGYVFTFSMVCVIAYEANIFLFSGRGESYLK